MTFKPKHATAGATLAAVLAAATPMATTSPVIADGTKDGCETSSDPRGCRIGKGLVEGLADILGRSGKNISKALKARKLSGQCKKAHQHFVNITSKDESLLVDTGKAFQENWGKVGTEAQGHMKDFLNYLKALQTGDEKAVAQAGEGLALLEQAPTLIGQPKTGTAWQHCKTNKKAGLVAQQFMYVILPKITEGLEQAGQNDLAFRWTEAMIQKDQPTQKQEKEEKLKTPF